MSLKTTQVSKCLDKKLKIAGFEIPDILLIFITISVLNFLFGQTSMKLILVWLPSLVLAMVLRYGKKGKPDNYLVHWLRFQFRPGVLSAFKEASYICSPPRLRRMTDDSK